MVACSGSPEGDDDLTTTGADLSPTTAAAPTTTGPAPTISPSATSSTTAPTTTTVPEAAIPLIEITGDAVVGPESIHVSLGEEARLDVVSDTAMELHVHGYDLVYVLEEGQVAEVRFLADVPGIFEVESHPGHLAIVDLVVEP